MVCCGNKWHNHRSCVDSFPFFRSLRKASTSEAKRITALFQKLHSFQMTKRGSSFTNLSHSQITPHKQREKRSHLLKLLSFLQTNSMAEGIMIPVFADLLSKLGSTALQEIALIYGVEEELAKLKDTFCALQSVLLDAEQMGDLSLAVKDWLGKLKDAAYDADDLLDELSYETLRREVISRDQVRIFFSQHELAFPAKMVHKFKKLRQRLELIAADRTQFHFSETIPDRSRTKDREYTHSFVREEEMIGRDEEKEEIVKRLLEINEKQDVSVDAIVGVGGLGKTMLAKSVINHKRVKDAFDLRLWVCISEIFDLKIIVGKIIEAATKQRTYGLEMEFLQRALRDQIDEKKYLLVMDDLWNEDGERWAELKRLLRGGAKGSKILITTRSELVAEVSEATSPYILKGLSESNSWILFKQMAFKEGEEPESPNKIEIGKEIAKKCMGVPLVIRTIGRLLYFKISEVEWLSFKNSELSTITQQDNEMTQVLKLSYNHLPSHLKPCFAYCSLFSKDYQFEKDEMINLWVAEGFVQSQGENECLEDVGNEFFMELIWRSIFQDVQRNKYGDVKGCQMHDLMHDIARLVAGTECFTLDSDIKNVNERTRRVSFDCGGESKWFVLFTSQLKPYKLRTFLSSSHAWDYRLSCELNETELEARISSVKSLRVLDLQWLRKRKVPFSIGILKHLRFLNLSQIKSFPSSITKLHNLQTLNISYCSSLKELPRDIGSLINLRHLELSCNESIERLPDSTSKLLHLRSLILNDFTSLIELPENIGNMVDLRFLHLCGNYSIELLPNSIAKLQKLQLLNLEGCEFLRELPRDVSNLVNLKHLDLEYCDRLRSMPLGLNKLTGLHTMNLYAVGPSMSYEDSGLWQLNTLINIRGRLCIRDLHHLRKDSSQANSVNLKDNHGVRDLILEWSEIDYNPNGIDHDFVVLEKLHPNKNVETLSIDGYGGVRLSSWVSSLSNLTNIKIENCKRLQYVPRLDRLPNLQNLFLRNLKLIEYVDNNETVDEFHSSVFFPSLQSLFLCKMDKLKGWWKSREFTPKDRGQSFLLPSFQCLSRLWIMNCPRMFSIPSLNLSLKELHLSYSNASPEDYTQEALDLRDDLYSSFQHLTTLHSLSIIDCRDLVMLPDWINNLTSLQELTISYCPKLTLLPEGIRQLSSLRKLTIASCSRLEDWSKIGNLTSLQELNIKDCEDLVMLPDWISNLTSLQELTIIHCPKLTLLSEGIRQLSSLRKLTISRCGRLEERCRPQIGEDWSKIAHVEYIKIGW